MLSSLDKNQLTNLILSNQEALEIIGIESKREALKKLTNNEIRLLLKGVEGISRYRKSELIEMVLKNEKLKNSKRL